MRRSSFLRLAVGIAISAILLGVTLARVDLGRTAEAIGAAAPLGLLAAVAIVLVDLNLRALRWLVLLRGADAETAAPPYRLAFGYLSIGFAANAVLPARLGDVARAMLAGTAFGMPRLAMLGTIMVERLADGLTMLALAFASSLLVTARVPELRQLATFGLVAAVIGGAVLVVGWFALPRLTKGDSGVLTRV